MKKKLAAFIFAVCTIATGSIHAAPITLDFEGFTDLELIVRIGHVQIQGGIALEAGQSLNELEAPPRSGLLVAAPFESIFTLLFDAGTDIEEIGAYATYAGPLTVRYFGVDDQLLGSLTSRFNSNLALSGDVGSAPNEYFAFLSPSLSIMRVDFMADIPQAFVLDDITFTIADAPSEVPEPGTLYLLLAGVLILTLRKWRAGVGTTAFLVASSVCAQSPIGTLEVFPQVVPIGVPTTVTARISLTSPRVLSGGTLLNEIGPDGRVVARLAQFKDDGTNGDQTAGDQIYTARFEVQNAQARDFRIVASIAYSGSLIRVTSEPAVVSIAADANLATGTASAAESNLNFRSASGALLSTIPLAAGEESIVNPVSPRTIVKTYDRPLLCQLQSRAGILTWRLQMEEPVLDEGAELPSQLRFFSASGVLLFTTNSRPGTIFFADSETGNISRSCSRILLGELNSDGTNIRTILLSDSGTPLGDFDLSGVITELQEIKISANGKYGAIRGLLGSGLTQQSVILVIDLDTGARAIRKFNAAEGYAFFVENGTGSFAIIVEETFRENLP